MVGLSWSYRYWLGETDLLWGNLFDRPDIGKVPCVRRALFWLSALAAALFEILELLRIWIWGCGLDF